MMKYACLLGPLLFVALSACSCGQKAQVAPSGEVADAASEFVEMMARGDFEAAANGFDAKMKAALTPAGLLDVWASLSGKFGTFQEQAGVRTAQEQGYDAVKIPSLILENNLFGIEIDERAGDLAAFALMMKAREKDRRFFSRGVKLNICVLENVSFTVGAGEKINVAQPDAC